MIQCTLLVSDERLMKFSFKICLWQDANTVLGQLSLAIFGENRVRHRKNIFRVWVDQQKRSVCVIKKVKENITESK